MSQDVWYDLVTRSAGYKLRELGKMLLMGDTQNVRSIDLVPGMVAAPGVITAVGVDLRENVGKVRVYVNFYDAQYYLKPNDLVEVRR